MAEEAAKAQAVAIIKADKARKEAEDKARDEHAAAVELKMEKDLEDKLEEKRQKIAAKYKAY